MRFSAICTRGTQVKEVPSDYFRLGQGVKGPLIVTFWRMWNLSSACDPFAAAVPHSAIIGWYNPPPLPCPHLSVLNKANIKKKKKRNNIWPKVYQYTFWLYRLYTANCFSCEDFISAFIWYCFDGSQHATLLRRQHLKHDVLSMGNFVNSW